MSEGCNSSLFTSVKAADSHAFLFHDPQAMHEVFTLQCLQKPFAHFENVELILTLQAEHDQAGVIGRRIRTGICETHIEGTNARFSFWKTGEISSSSAPPSFSS